mmetsp:Transcript_12098/g.35788  ORF Transcript_12098/g.35788 Transcript_12098/m.35788 type:complete len:252 (+) Transcript_12098:414-1169(+)
MRVAMHHVSEPMLQARGEVVHKLEEVVLCRGRADAQDGLRLGCRRANFLRLLHGHPGHRHVRVAREAEEGIESIKAREEPGEAVDGAEDAQEELRMAAQRGGEPVDEAVRQLRRRLLAVAEVVRQVAERRDVESVARRKKGVEVIQEVMVLAEKFRQVLHKLHSVHPLRQHLAHGLDKAVHNFGLVRVRLLDALQESLRRAEPVLVRVGEELHTRVPLVIAISVHAHHVFSRRLAIVLALRPLDALLGARS